MFFLVVKRNVLSSNVRLHRFGEFGLSSMIPSPLFTPAFAWGLNVRLLFKYAFSSFKYVWSFDDDPQSAVYSCLSVVKLRSCFPKAR